MASQLPIIVLGCPRSGTTLVRRLLDAHPSIHCAGESFLLRGSVRFLSGETVAEGINYGPVGGLTALGIAEEELKDRLRHLALGFHQQLAAAAGKPRCAIKTAVDSFYIPQIIDLFRGHAQFLCVVRHGLDVALSLREFTEVMEGPIEELMPFINRHRRLMPAFADAWASVSSAIVEAAEQYPAEVMAIRFEDLVATPHEVLTGMFDFLGESCSADALLERAFRPADVSGLGDYKTFATRGLVPGNVARWRQLPARVQAELAPLVNPLLGRLGYEPVEAADQAGDAMRLHELAMMYKTTRGEGQ